MDFDKEDASDTDSFVSTLGFLKDTADGENVVNKKIRNFMGLIDVMTREKKEKKEMPNLIKKEFVVGKEIVNS